MTARKKTGDEGEEIAKLYLQKNGYQIIGENLHSRFGEIDLVGKKGNDIFFIEVKRRKNKNFGSALESVTEQKKKKVLKTAEYYTLKNPKWSQLVPYFSIVAIDGDGENESIEFIKNVF